MRRALPLHEAQMGRAPSAAQTPAKPSGMTPMTPNILSLIETVEGKSAAVLIAADRGNPERVYVTLTSLALAMDELRPEIDRALNAAMEADTVDHGVAEPWEDAA